MSRNSGIQQNCESPAHLIATQLDLVDNVCEDARTIRTIPMSARFTPTRNCTLLSGVKRMVS